MHPPTACILAACANDEKKVPVPGLPKSKVNSVEEGFNVTVPVVSITALASTSSEISVRLRLPIVILPATVIVPVSDRTVNG